MKKAKLNTTGTLLGPESTWPGASLYLYDLHPQNGGTRIFIYGTGQALLQRVSPEKQELRYEFKLEQAEVQRLFQLCIKHDLMGIEPPKSYLRPAGSTTISITLVNADGLSRIVHHWTGTKNARFEAVHRALLELERYRQYSEPTYTGRFDTFYRPRRGWSGVPWKIRKRIVALKKLRLDDLIEPPLRLLLVIGPFLPYILLITIQFGLAYWWGDIDPTYNYGFGGGIFHGLVWNQNIIIMLFTGRDYFAPLHTGWGYRIGFGVGAVFISLFISALGGIIQAFREQR